jgi:hypothetical protein
MACKHGSTAVERAMSRGVSRAMSKCRLGRFRIDYKMDKS